MPSPYKIGSQRDLFWNVAERTKDTICSSCGVRTCAVKHKKKYGRRNTYGPRCDRCRQLFMKYKDMPGSFTEIIKSQNYKCACCGKAVDDKTAQVDHDHVSGKFRALLCGNCNSSMGQVGDDIRILQMAIEYLKRHHVQT